MDDASDERLSGDETRQTDVDPSTDEPGDRRLVVIVLAIAAVSIVWAVFAYTSATLNEWRVSVLTGGRRYQRHSSRRGSSS